MRLRRSLRISWEPYEEGAKRHFLSVFSPFYRIYSPYLLVELHIRTFPCWLVYAISDIPRERMCIWYSKSWSVLSGLYLAKDAKKIFLFGGKLVLVFVSFQKIFIGFHLFPLQTIDSESIGDSGENLGWNAKRASRGGNRDDSMQIVMNLVLMENL